MKCDDCKHMVGEGASIECPWPVVWCSIGHWEGLGKESAFDKDDDPWKDCKDFYALWLPQER